MREIKFFVESKVFGVCTYLGERLNMPRKDIRLFFIYLSFITAGSPVLIYLILAFLLKMRDLLNGEREAIWDF